MNAHRVALLAKSDELIERIYAHRSEIAADRKEYDQADVTLQTVIRELAYATMENEIRMMAEVELSLHRLETGEYGLCGSCGVKISTARLEAIPWTRVCVVCAGGRHEGGVKRCDIEASRKAGDPPRNVIRFQRSGTIQNRLESCRPGLEPKPRMEKKVVPSLP